jgi:hypothetical protein
MNTNLPTDVPSLHVEPMLRSTQMSLMNEALARAHCHEPNWVAENERRAVRLLVARRKERRAERAAQRARRLAALAAASADRAHL